MVQWQHSHREVNQQFTAPIAHSSQTHKKQFSWKKIFEIFQENYSHEKSSIFLVNSEGKLQFSFLFLIHCQKNSSVWRKKHMIYRKTWFIWNEKSVVCIIQADRQKHNNKNDIDDESLNKIRPNTNKNREREENVRARKWISDENDCWLWSNRFECVRYDAHAAHD